MSLPGLRTQELPGQRAASKAPLSGTQLSHLGDLLAPRFLPASMSQPPTASSAQTGNRVIAVTTKTQNRPKLTDSAVLSLTAGALTWSFNTAFTTPPSVTATPEGSPPSAGTTLFVFGSPGTNEVIIKSTDATDARVVHLQAVQPQEGD